MEVSTMFKKSILLLSVLSLTACLQQGAGEEKTQELNNGDFAVEAPPEETGGGTGGETTAPPVNPPDTSSLYSFRINQGQTLTKSETLQLDFYSLIEMNYLKISYGSTCATGTWVPYVNSQTLVSAQKNQIVEISVQYRDLDNRMSPCLTQKIMIDQVGPDILFKKYPLQVVEQGQNVELIFEVTDNLSGVASVSCTFQGATKTCYKGTNTINIPSIAEGDYSLKVDASDNLGNSSSKAVNFKVTSTYRMMSQKATVREANTVDVLFVMDNSGSMAYEQKSMGSRVANFLQVLRGLDYQIAVTTTDPRSSVAFGDGQLVPMKGLTNEYMITSSMNENTAKTILSNTLQRTETGDASEQGINAATRTVERALADRTSRYGKFIRDSAQLAVVVISDEDESANKAKNDPNFILNLVRENYTGKSFTFHSIIARPGDTACLKGEGATAGTRYAEFSKLTGGVIGDVCAMDYAAQVNGIAEGVRKTLKTITLACAPVIDATHTVVVLKDGAAYSGTNSISGLNLVFNDMLPAGSYEVLYTCLK